jgi:predicted DNA-binding transcriptional regulator AlpA
MRLIKMARVEEITGFHKVSISNKVKSKNFPKQYSGEPGTMEPYLWDEKVVVRWLAKLESSVLKFNKKHPVSSIAKMVSTTQPIIRAILLKYRVPENVVKEQRPDFFHLVLSTSAQLNNNRGI